MEYLTAKEVAEQWSVTERQIYNYCIAGKISGTIKRGNIWLIPIDAHKPIDARCKQKENLQVFHDVKCGNCLELVSRIPDG